VRDDGTGCSTNDLVQILGLSKKEELGSALNTNGTIRWRWAKENKPLPGPTLEQIIRAMNLQFFAAEVFGTVQLAKKSGACWLAYDTVVRFDFCLADVLQRRPLPGRTALRINAWAWSTSAPPAPCPNLRNASTPTVWLQSGNR